MLCGVWWDLLLHDYDGEFGNITADSRGQLRFGVWYQYVFGTTVSNAANVVYCDFECWVRVSATESVFGVRALPHVYCVYFYSYWFGALGQK